MAPPAIFLAITYYFGWNAIHGKSGLEAQTIQRAELAKAQQGYLQMDASLLGPAGSLLRPLKGGGADMRAVRPVHCGWKLADLRRTGCDERSD